jgi:thiol:disulfide interchange protein
MSMFRSPRFGFVTLWSAALGVCLSLPAPLAANPVDPFSFENQVEAGDPADPFSLVNQAKRGSEVPGKLDPVTVGTFPEIPRKVSEAIRFTTTLEPSTARPGEVVQITITGVPAPGWHTYAFWRRTSRQDPDGFNVSRLTFVDPKGYQPLWPVVESEPKLVNEPGLGMALEHGQRFTLKQDLLILPDTKPGKLPVKMSIRLQVCFHDEKCLPGVVSLETIINVKGEPVALSRALEERRQEKAPEPVVVPVDGPTSPDGNVLAGDTGLWALLLAAVGGGILSLLTPCVLPMLPITVSFFLKQSESAHHRPVTMALVYCLTIVVVLTGGGLLLMEVLRQFIAFWGTQFLLAGLCLFFALSLLGMYEIQLPSWLSNLTSAQEGRGGLVGTIFMALTFTIISFACVGPIYGTFIALATGAQSASDWLKPVLATLVFSVTFASPFFFLALFPALLRKMPKSGGWMTTLKVVMGFIVLAVAFTFLRAGEILWKGKADLLTYDLVLGMFIALSLLCGLYLLAFFRLPHDDPSEHVGGGRLLFSVLFLSFAFYLLPSLFQDNSSEKQPRNGAILAWVDSFISRDRSEGGLPWIANLNEGLKEAQEQRKLVFVDFTGLG